MSESCRGVVGASRGQFSFHFHTQKPFGTIWDYFQNLGSISLCRVVGVVAVVGVARVAGFDRAANCHQERKVSKERKQLVKRMKKEIGLAPHGNLQPYSTSQLPDSLGIRLNSRERESLDIQYGLLEVTWSSGFGRCVAGQGKNQFKFNFNNKKRGNSS